MVVEAKGYVSDGYFTDNGGFTKETSYDTHGDLNLSVGIGPEDDTWLFSVWARNIFAATPNYHPELDRQSDGFVVYPSTPGDFTTYGIKYQYNYQ